MTRPEHGLPGYPEKARTTIEDDLALLATYGISPSETQVAQAIFQSEYGASPKEAELIVKAAQDLYDANKQTGHFDLSNERPTH